MFLYVLYFRQSRVSAAGNKVAKLLTLSLNECDIISLLIIDQLSVTSQVEICVKFGEILL